MTSYTLGGVVLDEHGDPAAGVTVALAGGPGPFPDIAALTGADGRFSFGVSTAGVYTVQCLAPDGRSARGQGEAVAGAGAPLVLRLG
ncbi:carboxypeptidase-like regulatory domain-containing protein [Streptomyces sp. NPDC032472]|uniref:carboxypeptidase-like regulatory domain-containing protein n=1 Tax=Streptomyces sp. NPDC032472 TaxID=3155018 RepID=UPI00340A3EF1